MPTKKERGDEQFDSDLIVDLQRAEKIAQASMGHPADWPRLNAAALQCAFWEIRNRRNEKRRPK
jgi:hypothetical protein